MCDEEKAKSFYDREYLGSVYANELAEKHTDYQKLRRFIGDFQLYGSRCLEIGCGRGIFQDFVEDYTGVDLSDSVRQYLHKPFYQASATRLPFEDNEFEVVWSIEVLEHISNLEEALVEMRRVLRPNGLLYLEPAWFCAAWFADGYSVRPYSDFNLKGKLIKATIPFRESALLRRPCVLTRRLIRYIEYAFSKKEFKFKYRKLKPNYEHFWQSDSDAVNSMDPFDVILWFMSRGDTCLSHLIWTTRLFARRGAVIIRIRK
jgi:ubiquinone/menaquinone biosynthesis C-methylase UbiE